MRIMKTPMAGLVAVAVAGVMFFGAAQSGASPVDTREQVSMSVLSTVDLEAENEALLAQVEELETKLAESELDSERKAERIEKGIEWRVAVQQKLYATQRELRRVRSEGSDLAAQDIEWIRAYVNGGGAHLDEMIDVILPCESGGWAGNPHDAIGRTHDYGRAQINRKTWKSRFESMFATNFESGSLDPTMNGAFAAHVENEQGLSAWVCWNKR